MYNCTDIVFVCNFISRYFIISNYEIYGSYYRY